MSPAENRHESPAERRLPSLTAPDNQRSLAVAAYLKNDRAKSPNKRSLRRRGRAGSKATFTRRAGSKDRDLSPAQTPLNASCSLPVFKHWMPYHPKEQMTREELYFQNSRLRHWVRKDVPMRKEGFFVVMSDSLDVYESVDSWTIVRRLRKGDVVHPAAMASKIDDEFGGQFVMQPILPSGAVEMKFLVWQEGSFHGMLNDTKSRAQKLKTDPLDLEGPSLFAETRTVKPLLRYLNLQDPWQGWKRGDCAALNPELEDKYGDLILDYCTIVGKGWLSGELEVKFKVGKEIQIIPVEHLYAITQQEASARRSRLSIGVEHARIMLRVKTTKPEEVETEALSGLKASALAAIAVRQMKASLQEKD